MKKVILTLSIILIGIMAFAQGTSIKNLNQAKIEFETEIIDYGTIEQNANGIREFKFKNVGNAPLIISDAKKSCGCTIPTWPKAPIKPGESSTIKVKYATDRLGLINKSVTIISNAERSNITLRIKGKVI
jgi:LEA14-like dessication related protein